MHCVVAAGMLVLDEADQLLAPQFAADVSRIALHCGKRLPSGLQTIVVSATLSPQVCPSPSLTEQHTHLCYANFDRWRTAAHALAGMCKPAGFHLWRIKPTRCEVGHASTQCASRCCGELPCGAQTQST